jgi:hypothetical protein
VENLPHCYGGLKPPLSSDVHPYAESMLNFQKKEEEVQEGEGDLAFVDAADAPLGARVSSTDEMEEEFAGIDPLDEVDLFIRRGQKAARLQGEMPPAPLSSSKSLFRWFSLGASSSPSSDIGSSSRDIDKPSLPAESKKDTNGDIGPKWDGSNEGKGPKGDGSTKIIGPKRDESTGEVGAKGDFVGWKSELNYVHDVERGTVTTPYSSDNPRTNDSPMGQETPRERSNRKIKSLLKIPYIFLVACGKTPAISRRLGWGYG